MRTFILLVLTTTVSCQREDNLDSIKLFEPPTEIKASDLKKLGYNYIDGWSCYNKVNGDTAYIYQTHFDTDPVFSRIVDVGNWKIQDSIGIKTFIESKDGTLVTPLFRDSVATRFFVQGISSGQFFRCSLTPGHLTIEFHYADSQENIRSTYRKSTGDGLIVEFEKDGRSYKTK